MKDIFKILMAIVLVFAYTANYAQNAKGTEGTFALTNAKIETVTNGTIESGTIVLQDGKILDVGANVSVPSGAEVIDCSGLTVYPGMIEGGARLGLTEVNSDARTRDYNEIGDVIPQMKALTAVNPNSVLIPVTRVSGVTTSLAVPTGGLFSGTAALVNLHGYTPDQMYAGFEGVVLNFPASGRRSRWDRRSDEDIKKEAEKALKKLNEVWGRATEYHSIDSAMKAEDKKKKLDYYPEMEALLPVVRGEQTLLIEVNAADDIEAAIEWVSDKDIKVVFTGVSEGWRKAEEIAKADIPVITGPVLSIPNRAYDKYDRSYANAGLMKKAGVKVAIRTADAENVRNLPYHAGFAATYGMGKEEALKAITIIPAEIFGVADQLGSLEKGKVANLFVTDGDAFETKTQVKHLFVGGWKIPLES
ncbi:amidohydrolase, partial [Fulvivirga sp. RKSG066]|uniref:amidohydrolase family protein n=1 Tax=Fulvivirga aurantia TaxID=2529383 RepID=UPI0012BB70D1|nr:amidohydrolase [Fulvivirga aurantia]